MIIDLERAVQELREQVQQLTLDQARDHLRIATLEEALELQLQGQCERCGHRRHATGTCLGCCCPGGEAALDKFLAKRERVAGTRSGGSLTSSI